MKLKPKDRPAAGFAAEEGTARSLKGKGHSVFLSAKNKKNTDMVVDGKNVEVKAAVETSYKGSDGHPITGFVFSNMKKNPSADRYILKCMSPDRKRVLKEYHIPSGKVKQKTLTITRNSKYNQFMKKASQPRPYRRGEVPPPRALASQRQPTLKQRTYGVVGAGIGAVAGYGPKNIYDAAMVVAGKQENTKSVSFKRILATAVLMPTGREIGQRIARNEESRANYYPSGAPKRRL